MDRGIRGTGLGLEARLRVGYGGPGVRCAVLAQCSVGSAHATPGECAICHGACHAVAHVLPVRVWRARVRLYVWGSGNETRSKGEKDMAKVSATSLIDCRKEIFLPSATPVRYRI